MAFDIKDLLLTKAEMDKLAFPNNRILVTQAAATKCAWGLLNYLRSPSDHYQETWGDIIDDVESALEAAGIQRPESP